MYERFLPQSFIILHDVNTSGSWYGIVHAKVVYHERVEYFSIDFTWCRCS